MKKKSTFAISFILIGTMLVSSSYFLKKNPNFNHNIKTVNKRVAQSPNNKKNLSTKETTKVSETTSEVSFISAGDILFHMPEVNSVKDKNSYNFKPIFSEVKDIINSKDIAVANLETTINPKKKLSGYPTFNSPVQTLDALKDTGFKVLLNDHNHSLDTGIEGLRSTNSLIKKYGFKVLGSGEANEDKSVIIEKNNIKIGMLSYTYGTNFGVQYKDMINYIDDAKIKQDVEKIKPKCDFLIVYLHLGTEYVRTVEPSQASIVNKVANLGADAILCSHPHVARKTDMLNVNGKKVLVNYSMGNFLSNQNDKYTDMGSMESLVIEKRGNVTTLKSAETIPVYRLRYSANGKTIYKVVPSNDLPKFKNVLAQNTVSYVNQVSNELKFNYSAPTLHAENK